MRCYTFLANAEVIEACRASPGNDDARHVVVLLLKSCRANSCLKNEGGTWAALTMSDD